MSHDSVSPGRSNGSAPLGDPVAIERERLGRKPSRERKKAAGGTPLYDGVAEPGGQVTSAASVAVGYVRVSTDQQADEGLSLEAQTAAVRAMATARRVEVEVIVDAGASAKTLRRPGMARLLALVDARAVDTVIVAKLDRLTRSVMDLGTLIARFGRADVSLVSVAETLDTGSASGRLVCHLLVSVSQWEREAIGERTRAVLAHKRSQGERIGTVPLGYRVGVDGVHLEPDDHERALLGRLQMAKAAGRSTRQIAADLNEQGMTTRRGTPWRHQYVARALRRA